MRALESWLGAIHRLAAIVFLAGMPAVVAAKGPAADPWDSLRFLAGEWRGTAEGRSCGDGKVYRSFELVLGDRTLHERKVFPTCYAKDKNPGGECHGHPSVLSYDCGRKAFVLLRAYEEGYVNQYVMDPAKSSPTRLVFNSEATENLDSRSRARETYEIVSPDELVEVFELAAPGKSFEVYSRTRLTRMKGSVVTATIHAAQQAEVTVHVHDEHGNSLPGATVELSPGDCDRGPLTSETDEAGVVVFRKVAGGRYVLMARFPGYEPGRTHLDTRTCSEGVCWSMLRVVPPGPEYDPMRGWPDCRFGPP